MVTRGDPGRIGRLGLPRKGRQGGTGTGGDGGRSDPIGEGADTGTGTGIATGAGTVVSGAFVDIGPAVTFAAVEITVGFMVAGVSAGVVDWFAICLVANSDDMRGGLTNGLLATVGTTV